jgi:hypothetical protein
MMITSSGTKRIRVKHSDGPRILIYVDGQYKATFLSGCGHVCQDISYSGYPEIGVIRCGICRDEVRRMKDGKQSKSNHRGCEVCAYGLK